VGKVNLSDVLERVDNDLDRVMDWINVLSIGEQQRVAFARLFLRNSKFAFLDEATSALDEDNQERLYQLLKEAGTGFISVGHRTTLIEYHDRVLQLDRSGSWEIKEETPPGKSKPAPLMPLRWQVLAWPPIHQVVWAISAPHPTLTSAAPVGHLRLRPHV